MNRAHMWHFMQQMQAMRQMMRQASHSQYYGQAMQQLQELARVRMMQHMHLMGMYHHHQNPMQAANYMWETMQAQAAAEGWQTQAGFWDWADDFFGNMDDQEHDEYAFDSKDMSAGDLEERIREVMESVQDRIRDEHGANEVDESSYQDFMEPAHAHRLSRPKSPADDKAQKPVEQESVEAKALEALNAARERGARALREKNGPGPLFPRPAKQSVRLPLPDNDADLQAKINEKLKAARNR